MQKVYRSILQANTQNWPVLIRGESGTGKRLTASSIHLLGRRKAAPFIVAGRSVFSPSWQEGELFGDESGAPARLFWAKSGVLSSVGEGTLFIREISELPRNLQSALLSAMKEHQYSPVGSTRKIPFLGRVVAATRSDLETLVRTDGFDEELYFYLSAMEIRLPPLRDRKSDLSLLADYFLNQFSGGVLAKTFSEEALDSLLRYDWPGNLRELGNVVHEAIACSPGPIIETAHLPPDLREDWVSERVGGDRWGTESDFERRTLAAALEDADGDITVAASNLGLDPRLVRRRLQHYGLASPAN
jgi:DNA-binding NtrC family response regulator